MKFLKHFRFLLSAETDGNDDDNIKKEDGSGAVKLEKDNNSVGNVTDKKDGQTSSFKSEKETIEAQRAKELKIAESEAVRDLRTQLK